MPVCIECEVRGGDARRRSIVVELGASTTTISYELSVRHVEDVE